jgi:TonB-linked SusC/RagA family outer membrane protein
LNEGLASMGSYKNSNKLIGFYNRLSYNFKNKYLLSASLRYEGSSRFGKNNKWGTFPAISAGWQIHEEDFMQDVSWLTNLKLRVGYGVTGNQDIPNYLSLERLQVSQRQFYLDGQWVNAYQPASNPNPDLKWEKKTEYNIGLDFGMFDSRLYGNIEFYKRNISDLLWWYSVPVPPNVFDTIYANVGEMTNQGIEIQLNYEPFKSKDFSWVTSVNFSKNNNKMVTFSNQGLGYELEFLKMTPAASTWSQLVREGDPVGNWVAPVFEGVDDNGNAIYKDVNGDGNIDIQSEEDREVVGNQYPDFDLSWNNNFRYKNFDLSVFFRGSFGQDALNYERMFYESWNPFLAGGNVLKSTLTNNPDYTGIQVYDSRFVEDASYLKLDNLTLGYNLELSKATTLRLYFTGQNLFTITNYSGADPEKAIGDINTSTETSGNSNLNYYPFTRTYLLGVNFKF